MQWNPSTATCMAIRIRFTPSALRCVPTLHQAMEQLYSGIGASEGDDVIINSCATEGNNTVILGFYFNLLKDTRKKHIITTQLEHPSVRESCRFLEQHGVKVTYLAPDREGLITAQMLKDAITDQTALVSVMWANNETGLILPIKEISASLQGAWRLSAHRRRAGHRQDQSRPAGDSGRSFDLQCPQVSRTQRGRRPLYPQRCKPAAPVAWWRADGRTPRWYR